MAPNSSPSKGPARPRPTPAVVNPGANIGEEDAKAAALSALADASTLARMDAPKLKQSEVVDKLLAQIRKVHGEGIVVDARQRQTFKHIVLGIFALDLALGGGIPEGLCTMIFGHASAGKTTVSLKAVAAAQRKHPDKIAVWVDAEGTFDETWAEMQGVDLERLKLVKPSGGEQAVDLTHAFLEVPDVCIVVLDSLPALIPMSEMEKSAEDGVVGRQAQLIGRFLRKATQIMNNQRRVGHWPTLILINQWRYKIGVMHGDPRTLPGGEALHYVASVKIEVKNKEQVGKDGNEVELVDHNEHSFRIHKNKVCNGPRNGEFEMIRNPEHVRGVGFIDDAHTVIGYGRKFGVITGGGGTWKIEGVEEVFRGKLEEFSSWLYDRPEVFEPLRLRLLSIQREQLGLPSYDWL